MDLTETWHLWEYQKNPIILDILHEIDKLNLKGFSVKLCWTPSHVGIRGNELADSSAKTASKILNCSIPFCDIKKEINYAILRSWQEEWNTYPNNKLHTLKPTIEVWPYPESRKQSVILTRLRIGHSRLTHSHLLKGEPSPKCSHCDIPITIKHILTDCPALNRERQRYFSSANITLA